jgi:CYTH domain-containing protein
MYKIDKMETEMKFKLKTLYPEIEQCPNYEIKQIYLNFGSHDSKSMIQRFFTHPIDWEQIKEMRLRNKSGLYTLTLKSDGDMVRNEYETAIEYNEFSMLLDNIPQIGSLTKVRYECYTNNNVLIEVDKYTGPEEIKGLLISEIEFDINVFTPEQIYDIAKKYLGDDIEDVTYDKKYKNRNLI